jgi:hypothetical protein
LGLAGWREPWRFWAGRHPEPILLVGVFVLGLGFAVNAPAWASFMLQFVTDEEFNALTRRRATE